MREKYQKSLKLTKILGGRIKVNWTASGAVIDGILTQLKVRNIPVVYVDRFNNPSGSGTTDHDIVVYGYDSNNNLIAHFGWDGKTHIKCSSPAAAAFIASACAITYY